MTTTTGPRRSTGRPERNEPSGQDGTDAYDGQELLLDRMVAAMEDLRDGNFRRRLAVSGDGAMARLATVFNEVAERNQNLVGELLRVRTAAGQEGQMGERLELPGAEGGWSIAVNTVNDMVEDLQRPTVELSRVLTAVAEGDLSQRMSLHVGGSSDSYSSGGANSGANGTNGGTNGTNGASYGAHAGAGGTELDGLSTTVNGLLDQLSLFASEVTRVAREIGTDGRLGGQAQVPGVAGTWRDLTDSVNFMAANLTAQVRDVSQVAKSVARGDLSRKISVEVSGEMLELKSTINTMVDQLSSFADEVTRVAREVGSDGRLGGQAQVPGVAGTWRDLTDSVNFMAANLTSQVRNIAQVATAVARGDLSQKIDVDARGEILELKSTINTMVDQLSAFADEVTRVAREVGTEGRLGGQAQVPGVGGTWRDLTDSVNFMAANLTAQVRSIASVTTAVARGDLSQKIDVDARGEISALKNTINTMVDQLSAFADEVTRVAREVGTEGRLGGQARVRGVAGTWKDLTDNVNIMAENLTSQVRSIATVATAVAGGDMSKKITVEAKGEVAALAETINGMVDTLRAFADEVTRVAREVGTEGILGGQARVPNVAGTWKDLTDSTNSMANNLTYQVRNIAEVTTAVAQGDLSKKIDVDARGEILELKNTINTMVDQLSAFASEVTRVAREVGTEGKLGGQAEVVGVSGTWQRLTESVNHLAGNLTSQVRAIAAVATAVTEGDLTRQITVDASGEVAELKDNINQMIANLKETTATNLEQDWLKTNLARISGMMQGHHDLKALASLIMSELAPLVSAQCGAFYLAGTDPEADVVLQRTASYGLPPDGATDSPGGRFRLGETLVGQAAADKKTILMTGAPNYIRISSGLGTVAPTNVILVPVLFEGQTLGVIELASVQEFTEVHQDLLEQLKETIGVNVNTIVANSRTEALLSESQRLAQELRARSEQLQQQQEELQYSNTELAEKAALLASQNRDIEIKNIAIEQASQELEERARQLSMASTYKSEFLANMSHELRTPLNSALILAKLLSDNLGGNLTAQQIEFAKTIYSAGVDLLQMIDDVLDLAKVEAGHMELLQVPVAVDGVAAYVESLYRPVAADKGLDFEVTVAAGVPPSLKTDRQRLQQILRNLLSNAVKFTHDGSVRLHIRAADPSEVNSPALRAATARIAFVVEDTGIGIPADKLALIFEAFQQADGTTSRKYGGTGLGLSISKELTRLIGGELQVYSEAGKGSTFTLCLPVEEQPARVVSSLGREALAETRAEKPRVEKPRVEKPRVEDERTIPPTSGESGGASTEAPDSGRRSRGIPPSSPDKVDRPAGAAEAIHTLSVPEQPTPVEPLTPGQLHGETVLVVDDDPRYVYALTTALEQHGLNVICKENGVDGIRALEQHDTIRLVLMDVMMPELDGNAAMSTIRRMPKHRDLPLIAVTAKAMKGDREKCLASGATDYVTKPVDIDMLLQMIAMYLPQVSTTPKQPGGEGSAQ